jgi:hypothetical protein
VFRKIIKAGAFVVAIQVPLLLLAYGPPVSHSSLNAHIESHNAPPQQTVGHVEVETLVLRSGGFHPKEIVRPPGRFVLALQNQSDDDELSLSLRQERGPSSRQIKIRKRQSKLRETLDLPPGRYVLTEPDHIDWICTIVITPQ